MSHEINTDRLLLRPVEVEDVDALHVLWSNERVRRFLWDGEAIPLEHTRQIVDKSISLFHEVGFGIWGVYLRGREQLIGFAGFWYFRSPPSLELLFGVAADDWDRGVATEAGRCLIHYAFRDLGFSTVEASTDVGNAGSVRVIEKLGMRLDRREAVDGLDTVFYTMTRDDWESAS